MAPSEGAAGAPAPHDEQQPGDRIATTRSYRSSGSARRARLLAIAAATMLFASLLGRCRASGVVVRPTAFAFGARTFRPGSAAFPHVAPPAPAASASASTASPWGQRRRSSSQLSSSGSSSTRLRSTTDGGRPAEEQVAATAVVAGSTEGGGEEEGAPSSLSSSTPALKLKKRQRRTVTGGLKNLPIALPAVELLNRALRTAKYLKIDEDKVKNPRLRARKLGALRLDTLAKGISRPLKDVIKAYEYELSVLHPFEATLADLTVRARAKRGHSTLPEVLGAVNELRKQVLEVGKKYVGLAKNATTKVEAVEAAEEGITAIEGLVLGEADVILELIEVQKALRKIPIVQLGTPTVVLVGAPNVGKSSIVRAISSGTPEVNNYPFTTRGMTLGHIEYPDWIDEKCQVMDTPGVLNRPDGERNEMEALTLASMQHLPTAVMFVLDLTGNSGALSSIENQIQIRNDLRARFPKRPWVDVVSKADLPQAEDDPAVALAPPGALRVSTEDGTGVPELEARVREMLAEVREVLALFKLRPQDD